MSANVLVVEDDPSLGEALSDTLKLAGYSVLMASDGRFAQDLLQTEHVDMVISDVQMQHVDGYDLLRHVRANFPN
ncbi:MAG TPA: response regulator, partial [Chromatiaceae bacterium]|nr:response regulator [Chromatiaceae bacterium]